MTYSHIVVLGLVSVCIFDLFIVRTRLLIKKIFWVSYAIMAFFQIVTNGVLTGFQIVHYSGNAILGSQVPDNQTPPMFGSGRFFFAPIEDLGFGFSLIVLTLAMWVYLGLREVQRDPQSGPPHRSVARYFK